MRNDLFEARDVDADLKSAPLASLGVSIRATLVVSLKAATTFVATRPRLSIGQHHAETDKQTLRHRMRSHLGADLVLNSRIMGAVSRASLYAPS